jgi:type III pantothenate kinase
MILAIDIGNTNTKTGIFQDDRISDFHAFSDDSSFYYFLENNTPDKVALSSVVPLKTKKLIEVLKTKFNIEPFIITNDLKFNLKLKYKNVNSLGTDRVCAAEGAFYLYKNSENYKSYDETVFLLAIDFGTATTVNVIEYPGEFIGGLIAPGIDMMFESLKNKTAQLPLVGINDYEGSIANDTKSSIAAGVVASVVGMAEKTINHLKTSRGVLHKESFEQLNAPTNVFVYITGGNADKIIPHLNYDFIYEEGLVLYGINALYELNKNLL